MSPKDKDEAEIKRVRELYDLGVTLFTKKEMRRVGRQIAAVVASGRPGFVDIENLEGDVFEITVGEPHMRWDNGSSQTQYKPVIRYRGLSMLVYQGDYETVQDRLFPLQICVRTIEPKPDFKPSPVEVLAERFLEMRSRWESSSECADLRALIKTTPMPHVRKIVAFGCGALDSPAVQSHDLNFFCNSIQHAFILTLRECLQDKQEGLPIGLIAQDPAYADTDKRVLGDAGIKIVEDPNGWPMVGRDTLVFSMAPSVPVRQIIADIATPAAMIWREVKPASPNPSVWHDESSPRVEAMIQDHYTRLDFIKCDEELLAEAFDLETAIYIRKDHGRVA